MATKLTEVVETLDAIIASEIKLAKAEATEKVIRAKESVKAVKTKKPIKKEAASEEKPKAKRGRLAKK